jgi:hypothetical protein
MIKHIIRACVPAVALICTLAACTSLRVKSDVNSALISTVHCHTFAWAGSFHGDSPLRSTIANPLNEGRLRAAIAARLASTGVQPATTEADCLVGYGIGAHTVVEGVYPYAYPYYGWGWGYGWDGGPYVYHEGIVAVDLYDAKSHRPLWHASVDQNLTGLSGAEAEKKINAAVMAIFTKFPG